MTRKSRVLLAIGAGAAFAILASVYFRTELAPRTIKAEVAALLEERRQLYETV